MKNQHMRQLFTLFLFCLTTFTSFASAPTVASSNFSFNAIDGGYFNLGWTAGNGARRLMVAKIGSQPTFVPQNGIDYDANTEFGLGQQVAPGEYIVYDPTGQQGIPTYTHAQRLGIGAPVIDIVRAVIEINKVLPPPRKTPPRTTNPKTTNPKVAS